MKHTRLLTIAAVLPLILLGACRKKESIGVEYRQESQEETAAVAAETFSGNAAPTKEVEPEIEAFFVQLGKATNDPAPLDVDKFISTDAMIEALESGGMLKSFTSSQRRDFEAGFRMGISSVGTSIKQMSYQRHRIMRVEAPSEKIREVFVQHYDTDLNITFPMRWWLAKTDAGWRAFDFQDLSIGIRTVELIGTMISAELATNREPWVEAFIPVVTRMQSINMADPEQIVTLKQPLERLRLHKMPDSIRTFASTMMIAVLQGSGLIDEAKAELLAAREGGYQSPMWHYQMSANYSVEERYDDAIQELDKHAATFGWDSDVLELLSDYHFQAGRHEEARSAALRALEDSPGSNSCLASLAAASTPEQLSNPSTAELFAQSNNPEAAYEMALDYLISLDSRDRALALFDVFRAKHPSSDLIGYYVEELKSES